MGNMERGALTSWWRAGFGFAVHRAIGAIFLYAGWLKARHPGEFMHDVMAFRLVPDAAAYGLAAVVPYLEIGAGLALLLGILRRGGRLVLGVLATVFLVALVTALTRHLDISCGCFAEHAARGGVLPWAIARDLAILAGLAWPEQKTRPADLRDEVVPGDAAGEVTKLATKVTS
jgi:uncharacterized membrane protein YphA (DoxX/SURF4 family)